MLYVKPGRKKRYIRPYKNKLYYINSQIKREIMLVYINISYTSYMYNQKKEVINL